MNGFGLHVIPMVGLILLSWLGLRSLGMERGAPPAAPGWPSGCTFPEVELPGGQSSQAATPEDDNKYKRNSESETNSPYIVVGTFEGLCPSNTFAGLPDTPSLEGAYEQGLLDGNLGQMASFQSTYKSTLRIEVPVWPEIRQAVLTPAQAQRLLEPLGTIPPAPPERVHSGNVAPASQTQAQDHMTA